MAVTSPSPNIECVRVCPLPYERLLSYGALTVLELLRIEPALKGTRAPHIGQLTRVIFPLGLTEATT